MRAFKFLEKSKRPILDSVFTEDELTHIREYCIDIIRYINNNENVDLLQYYPRIGMVEKRYIDGALSGVTINFFQRPRKRILMRIEINVHSIFFITTVRYMSVICENHTTFEHSLYEEL